LRLLFSTAEKKMSTSDIIRKYSFAEYFVPTKVVQERNGFHQTHEDWFLMSGKESSP
jgi:hypothetical protein